MATEAVVTSTLTIPKSKNASEVVALHDYAGVLAAIGIIVPAELTSKVIQLETSVDGLISYPVMSHGALVSLNIPGRAYQMPIVPAAPYLRLTSSSLEAAARVFTLIRLYTVA